MSRSRSSSLTDRSRSACSRSMSDWVNSRARIALAAWRSRSGAVEATCGSPGLGAADRILGSGILATAHPCVGWPGWRWLRPGAAWGTLGLRLRGRHLDVLGQRREALPDVADLEEQRHGNRDQGERQHANGHPAVSQDFLGMRRSPSRRVLATMLGHRPCRRALTAPTLIGACAAPAAARVPPSSAAPARRPPDHRRPWAPPSAAPTRPATTGRAQSPSARGSVCSGRTGAHGARSPKVTRGAAAPAASAAPLGGVHRGAAPAPGGRLLHQPACAAASATPARSAQRPRRSALPARASATGCAAAAVGRPAGSLHAQRPAAKRIGAGFGIAGRAGHRPRRGLGARAAHAALEPVGQVRAAIEQERQIVAQRLAAHRDKLAAGSPRRSP